MAKKEKLAIQKDKRMEPIDIELDAALGLLENANRQIVDLLTSLAPTEPVAGEEGAVAAAAPAELDDPQPESTEAEPASKEQ